MADPIVLIDEAGLRARGIKYSRVHRWRLVKAGRFPVPVKLSERRHAYVESEIDEWLARKLAART